MAAQQTNLVSPRQSWSLQDDHYLLTGSRRLTPAMLAEDLGRTVGSVNARLKMLRARGLSPSQLTDAAPAVYAIDADRAAIAEGVRDFLASEVRLGRRSLPDAVAVAARVKTALQADSALLSRVNWTVRRWVEAYNS